MLVTVPNVILCLSRYQMWFYACHSIKCNSMLVTIPNVILCFHSTKFDSILVTAPNVILCLSQHQMWFYSCHSTKWDSMLVTVPNVILFLSQYQMWFYACHSTKCDSILITAPNVIICFHGTKSDFLLVTALNVILYLSRDFIAALFQWLRQMLLDIFFYKFLPWPRFVRKIHWWGMIQSIWYFFWQSELFVEACSLGASNKKITVNN